MTAEVGVLNSIGVALAADSAVSIGREADKIYTSADKIFHLSCSAPVGAMIFGNAGLVGLPWETIIKVYRGQLAEKRFDTAHGYAENFLTFLTHDHGMFSSETQDEHTGMIIVGVLAEVRQLVNDSRITTARKKGAPLTDDEFKQLVGDAAQMYLDAVQKLEFLEGFWAADLARINKRYGKMINEIIKQVFDGLPVEPLAHKKLRALTAEVLARKALGDARTGIVVAGFGEKEFLPVLLHYDLEGTALDRLRYVASEPVAVNSGNRSTVVAFAQQEMVHSFMEGIDRDLLDVMQRSTQKLFTGAVDEIVKLVAKTDAALGGALEKALQPHLPKRLNELFDGWREERRKYHDPVLSITASLPKDELAAMAEALVNLTKFRRRVTTARETVGGPIDVALITKGDGFVWVKRKHYFAAELNPRVIARYQQGG